MMIRLFITFFFALCKYPVGQIMDIQARSRSKTPVRNKLILNAGVVKHYAFALQIFTGSLKKIRKKERILTLS